VDLLLLHHPQHRGLRHGGREVRARGPLLQAERLSRQSHQVNYFIFYFTVVDAPPPPPTTTHCKTVAAVWQVRSVLDLNHK
jgi:hypothetical protein